LYRGKDALEESDMTPVFVPASSVARPSSAAMTKGGLALGDLDDDSASSQEETDGVFRQHTSALEAEDRLATPGEYEENYGGNLASQRQLELHGPVGEIGGMMPSSDLLLSPALDSAATAQMQGVGAASVGDDGVIRYNYMRADAVQPADAPPARSMAALLRERYTRQRLEREQPSAQLRDLAPAAGTKLEPAETMSVQPFPEAVQPFLLHPVDADATLPEPVSEVDVLMTFSETPRGLPRRPLPIPMVGSCSDEAQFHASSTGEASEVPITGDLDAGFEPPPPPPQQEQPPPSSLREPQTARQPSFTQRRAEARALTPRGTDVSGLATSADEGDSAEGSPRSERLPQPEAVALGPQAQSAGSGTEDRVEEAPSMPPAILRERRDLETALYRI